MKNRGIFNLAIIKIALFRISLKLQTHLIKSKRRDFFYGRWRDVQWLLARKPQLTLVTPCIITRFARTFYPGITDFLQINEQTTKIVSRHRIYGQYLSWGKKRLIRIGPGRIGGGRFRCKNILDVPPRTIGQIGDRITEHLQRCNTGIVSIVIRP